MKTFIAACLITLVLLACRNASDTSSGSPENRDAAALANDPVHWPHTDSLEFIYFPDPSNQRKYHHLMIREPELLAQLLSNIGQKTDSAQQACSHNSKLYLFSGPDVFKTVYVSDSCRYLAYAINSNQHFVAMNDTTRHIMDSLIKAVQNQE